MHDQQPRDDSTDIAYLVVGVFGLAALVQVWRTKLKPWVVAHVEAYTGPVDRLGMEDYVSLAVLALPLVALLVVARSTLRRAKAKQAARQQQR